MNFMHMNQKGFANIILIILVVVLVGSVGYLTLVKKQNSGTNTTNQSLPTTQAVPTNSGQSTQLPDGSPTRSLTIPPKEGSSIPSSAWNVYHFQNAKYTFEVSYPRDWKVVNKTETGVNFADPTNKKQISVFVYTSDPTNSIRDVNQITASTPYDFQGMKATKLSGESGVTGGQANWLVFGSSNTFGVVTAPPEFFEQVVKSLDI